MIGNLQHINPADEGNHDHGLFYLDTGGRLAYINECCCGDIGYARDELVAHVLDELGVITDCQCFMSMFKPFMRGTTRRFETVVRRKDGMTFPAGINITPTQYGHRMLLRCELLGRDG